ncbi:MAG: endopeptidase La [Planctomycetes bacterium]|nr:endopeptidase La [Planctomycetota bacterium]
MSQIGTTEVVLVPVRNMVLFPGVVLPLMVGREATVRAIQAAAKKGSPVGLILQRDEHLEHPGPDDLYDMGTVANIVRYWTAPDGRHHAICEGGLRFKVEKYIQHEPYPVAEVKLLDPPEPETRKIEASFMALKDRAAEVLELAPGAPEEMAHAVEAIESPAMLADLVCTFVDVPPAEKQELLEELNLGTRLDQLNRVLGDWAEVLSISQKIRDETRGSMDEAQREYFLREQLRTIQRELGEEDGKSGEILAMKAAVEALQLPELVDRELRKEIKRLERTPEQAAEYSMLRSFLELAIELPWKTFSDDQLNLTRARKILDEDHYGIEPVKQRILEFLAVRKLNPRTHGPTLCLLGPPGVGKTSLGQSVARALGREFVRISLGGVHDEAEIRGHRRTYVGAMPGRILSGLRRARTRNPVFMLDELDKMGRGMHGDPAAALLEVLDPAQNNAFTDNYLGVPFDLSDVMFVATANVLDSVHPALRDRLEVLRLPGYTEEEKLQIAKRYLVKRQILEAGLKSKPFSIRTSAVRELIRYYTREAGVRSLEREIGSLCRHAAVAFSGRRRKPLTMDAEGVQDVLGHRRFEKELARRTRRPGVATGLAWTPVGGEILFIEASSMAGKGKLVLTGQLGDVMKESAQAAWSLVRAHADPDWQATGDDQTDLHLHIPAGAVPKDGPSAGVAMYAAIVSLLSGRCVRNNLAMTGEISLTGLVLPVGGVKEKVLAARSAGIKRVLLPRRNQCDWEELEDGVRKGLKVGWLDSVQDVLEQSLHAC